MGEVVWHPIEGSAYAALYSCVHKDLSVFATHTCMDGCEFHGGPNIMTEWGFKGADYPLMKSLMRGERGTPSEEWSYWIAEPKHQEDTHG